MNKCDRTGANPARVCDQLREKLGLNAIMMQVPIGLEGDHDGVVDLVTMKAIYFEGDAGQELREAEIPDELKIEAESRREVMLDALSNFSDELMELVLEDGDIPEEMIHAAVRKGVIDLELCPVFLGSAYKNRGVQPLLDSVTRYLPDPSEVKNYAIDPKNEEEKVAVTNDSSDALLSTRSSSRTAPTVSSPTCGSIRARSARATRSTTPRTNKKHKLGRIVRMHSDKMEDIDSAGAGDIVAMFGIDCASGDTFRDDKTDLTLSSMHIPETVIDLAIKPKDRKAQGNMSKALQRFSKEDPTFRVRVDAKSGETIISGMGELHLEVYIERMRREFEMRRRRRPAAGGLSRAHHQAHRLRLHPQEADGWFGSVRPHHRSALAPNEEGEFEMENNVTGGNIPREFISSVEKGFKSMLEEGTLIGAPVDGLNVDLRDGAAHSVDSSDNAFQAAARGCFREYYPKGKPQVLEPVMTVVIEGPTEFQGEMVGTVLQRRGILIGTTEDTGFVRIEAEVPLSEMFGYATDLRSATQGKAEFSMEFHSLRPGHARDRGRARRRLPGRKRSRKQVDRESQG